MSGILAFLFPSPIAQAFTAAVAGFVTYVVPVVVRKFKAAETAAVDAVKKTS